MNDLMERYVYAVTQKLPEPQRADIDKELRGLIEDMLEDRGAGEGSARQEEVEQVLLELGPPSEMAARYRGKDRYLIGPGLIDGYWTVLKIVQYSLAVLLCISYIIDLTMSQGAIGEKLLEYFVTLISVGIHGFAWVTAIFAFLEYRGVRQSKEEGWKPSELPPIPASSARIKPIEPVLGIFFSILFFVLFTFSIEWIGMFRFTDEQNFTIPFFNREAFAAYLPFVWGLTAISILRDAIKLVTRKWTSQITILHLIFNAASIAFAIFLLADPSIWNPSFMEGLVQAGLVTPGEDAYSVVNDVWNRTREGLVYVIVIVTLIDSVAIVMKRFGKRENSAVAS